MNNPPLMGREIHDRRLPGYMASTLRGKINKVIFSFVRYKNSCNNLTFSGHIQTLASMIKKTPDIRIVILLEAENPFDCLDKDTILKHLKGKGIDPHRANITFIELEPHRTWQLRDAFYPFIRDIFIMADDNTIILPKRAKRFSVDYSAMEEEIDYVKGMLGFKVIISDLVFSGGDIIFTDRFQYIGINTILANIDGKPSKEKVEAVKKKFEEQFGRSVIIVSDKEAQPIGHHDIFHVDMYLTPVGENEVLLADSVLGYNLMEELPRGSFESSCRNIYKERRKLVAEGLLYDRLARDPQELDNHEKPSDNITGLMPASREFQGLITPGYSNKEASLELQRCLSLIEQNLTQQGIVVAGYLPYLQLWKGDHFFTYNNMLLEDYTESDQKRVRRALVGISGMTGIDIYAEDVLRGFGFEVVPISGTFELLGAGSRGGLHCLTNETRSFPS